MKKEKLKAKVSEILWNDWDPIGINDSKECRDEYDCYVQSITNLLINGTDLIKLKNRLHQHCNLDMGMNKDKVVHSNVARKLLDLMK